MTAIGPTDASLTSNVTAAGDQYERTMSGIISSANTVGGDVGSGNSELGTMLSLSFKQAAAEITKDATVGSNQALSTARKSEAAKTAQKLSQ